MVAIKLKMELVSPKISFCCTTLLGGGLSEKKLVLTLAKKPLAIGTFRYDQIIFETLSEKTLFLLSFFNML